VTGSENALIQVLFTFDGPKSLTAMYRERSFQATAPGQWNKLPNRIKLTASKNIFCMVFKTLLFKLAYL